MKPSARESLDKIIKRFADYLEKCSQLMENNPQSNSTALKSDEFYFHYLNLLGDCRKYKPKNIEQAEKKTNYKEQAFYYVYGASIVNIIDSLMNREDIFRNGVFFPEGFDYSRDYSKLYKEILKYKEEAFFVFNYALKMNVAQKDLYEQIPSQKRLILQNLVKLAYLVDDTDTFLTASKEAVELNSCQAASGLVNYYCTCDNPDFELAEEYFEKCLSIPTENFNYAQWNAKIIVFSYLYHGLFNNGQYEKALIVTDRCIDYLNENKATITKSLPQGFLDITLTAAEDFKAKALEKQQASKEININSELLKEFFDLTTIELMSDKIKLYISTSLEIYNMISSEPQKYDFSATLMPIMKAVEDILYTVTIKNYLEYLKTLNAIDLYKVPKEFIIKNSNKLKSEISFIEFGPMIHSIARFNYETEQFIPNSYFVDFCKLNNVKDPVNTIKTMASSLKYIKEKRNLTAHKDMVSKMDADECRTYLLSEIKLIDFILTNFAFCFDSLNYRVG